MSDPLGILGEDRVGLQKAQDCAQGQQVELLGGEVIVLQPARKARNLCGQVKAVLQAQLVPCFALLELFDGAALLADEEVVDGHLGHLIVQTVPKALQEVAVTLFALQLAYQVHAGVEEPGADRKADRGPGAFRVLIEELEVLAEVEDLEGFFVLTGTEEVGLQLSR